MLVIASDIPSDAPHFELISNFHGKILSIVVISQ